MNLGYDPFTGGRFPVRVRTIEAHDRARDRRFPCEIWYPAADPPTAAPGARPLVLFSHGGGVGRRCSTFLTTHLASHGYVVAALDHSERVEPELAPADGESAAQTAARRQAVITSRVPDLRFLLDHLIDAADPDRIAAIGYSFGGWTVLATPEVEQRVRAVVALAPGGSANPPPGVLRAPLTFAWGRDVPTLYLVAERDTFTPLDGMYELFDRNPSTKRMVVLRRADHMHFLDNVEEEHEAVRSWSPTPELAWVADALPPLADLCPGEQAHTFVRGLALAHLDATLLRREEANRFLAGDLEAELARRGVDAYRHKP